MGDAKDARDAPSAAGGRLIERLRALSRGVAPGAQRLLTVDGLRAVADICPGDEVVTYDPNEQLSAPRLVSRVEQLSPEPIWEIGLAEDRDALVGGGAGRRLRTTRHHKLLTATGWRRVHRLRPGDFLATADADGERLRSEIAYVRRTSAVEPVYAIAVSGRAPLILERSVALGGVASGLASTLAWRLGRLAGVSTERARAGALV